MIKVSYVSEANPELLYLDDQTGYVPVIGSFIQIEAVVYKVTFVYSKPVETVHRVSNNIGVRKSYLENPTAYEVESNLEKHITMEVEASCAYVGMSNSANTR